MRSQTEVLPPRIKGQEEWASLNQIDTPRGYEALLKQAILHLQF
uniref:Uncharacterized protein n=1 Tax=Arundo donax TaxID=35708 RepID=A0A0A8ZWB4_ARUDO